MGHLGAAALPVAVRDTHMGQVWTQDCMVVLLHSGEGGDGIGPLLEVGRKARTRVGDGDDEVLLSLLSFEFEMLLLLEFLSLLLLELSLRLEFESLEALESSSPFEVRVMKITRIQLESERPEDPWQSALRAS